MRESEIRTAILISGSGTTARSILEAWKAGRFNNVAPVLLLADRLNTNIEPIAEEFGVPYHVEQKKAHGKNLESFGDAINMMFKKYGVDFYGQHGWLSFTPDNVTSSLPGLNQHNGPLDPGRNEDWGGDFGGHKMYGPSVVASRLAYSWITDSDYWTESVVHHVGSEFDTGRLITADKFEYDIPDLAQPVTIKNLFDGSVEYLKEETERIWKGEDGKGKNGLLGLEHKNVVHAYELLDERGIGGLPSEERPTPLVPIEKRPVLAEIKTAVVTLYSAKKAA